MIYIENVFVCISAPLLIAFFCMEKRYFCYLLFCMVGMGVCLLSAYINTFFTIYYETDIFHATVEIAPVIEETIKLLPLLFYLFVFEPDPKDISVAALMIATGFATFENICYLIQNGAGNFMFIFFRGFGTGAMHIINGAIVGYGMVFVWQRDWLKIAGTCGLLGITIAFHGIYNLLVAYGGNVQYIAYALPVGTMILGWSTIKRLTKNKIAQ